MCGGFWEAVDGLCCRVQVNWAAAAYGVGNGCANLLLCSVCALFASYACVLQQLSYTACVVVVTAVVQVLSFCCC
jgi:hypothetical protein